MKRLLILAACSSPPAATPIVVPPRVVDFHVPAARLPDTVQPQSYDVRLEVDPDREGFSGEVTLRAHVVGRYVWLHASRLKISSSSYPIAKQEGELVAFDLGSVVDTDIALDVKYTGRTDADQEGLFRQQARGNWYLYAQGESVFARRWIPCLDEPRFKVPWRITVVAPSGHAAAANAPEETAVALPDGRIEHRFAATAPLASYLVSIAVGPFAVVDIGHKRRLLVEPDDKARVDVGKDVDKLVAYLEDYFGSPLPVPKLDFVAVPQFFGAMENPGLVTIERDALVGGRRKFVEIAGHELAHQWLGDLVGIAWWDDLWVPEAFAQFLAQAMARALGVYDDAPLRQALAREDALAADDAVDARALHHKVELGIDADRDFDAISYEKGAALLSSLERVGGKAAMRDALRRFIAKHANGVATTKDLLDAFGDTPLRHALEVDIEVAGAPWISILCTQGKAIASPRHAVAPACGKTCAFVVDRPVELGACPASNELGYYLSTGGARGTGVAQIAYGDDLAAALQRGELELDAATKEMQALAKGDVYAQLGGLAIARAMAPMFADTGARVAKAYAAQLANMFAANDEVRDALLVLADLPAPTAAQKQRLASALDVPNGDLPMLIALAAPTLGKPLFDKVVALSGHAAGLLHDLYADLLGTFGPALADEVVALVADGKAPPTAVMLMLARRSTIEATWAAIRARLAQLAARLSPKQLDDLVEALSGMCAHEDEVAAALDGVGEPRTVDKVRKTIERCRNRASMAVSTSTWVHP